MFLCPRERSEAHLDILLNRFHRPLKAKTFTVQAEIIVPRIRPFLSGIIAVKITAVLVCPLDKLLYILSGVRTALNRQPNTVIL